MRIAVAGIGAVSPAGWGVCALRDAVDGGKPLPVQKLDRPGWTEPLPVRPVPATAPPPAFMRHPRMRRTSSIAQYLVGAAVEALGPRWSDPAARRLGIVVCVMAGCVNYSKRFYAETLADPATASPLIFPES